MKKLVIVCAIGSLVLFFTTTRAAATTITVEIEAMIDGRDWLIITGNTLQWHHFDYAAVGRHEGLNEPTIISTKLNNVVQMDHVSWFPEWPEEPPAEIRYEAFSSVFTNLVPSVPPTDMVIEDVTLILIQSRWATTLKEFTEDSVIIEFNDNPPANPDWYKVQVNIDVIPEPATVFLLGLGGLALRRKRRK